MRKLLLTTACLIATGLVACKSQGAAPPAATSATPVPAPATVAAPPSPSASHPIKARDDTPPPREGLGMSEFSIRMRRGVCFGRCPQYTVTVNAAGQVDYIGERFVGVDGERQHRADMDKLGLLRQQAQAVFASTKDVVPGAASCPHYATDMPQVTLTLTDANGSRQLRHYTGCANPPPALGQLEQLIDEVAGVDEWVTGKATQ
ncbi:DUF6438 domain-containing protein [Solimonas marina]|uniref:DUF6438 domain-containing protein n=1 Tax=Solimonas marina TaxID=2714601 RepID=UPI0019D25E6F|nr:DUF6438 domain-containing protein [Solimonas marina]